MTREQRNAEVVSQAKMRSLVARPFGNNEWLIDGSDGDYRGMLVYNQKSQTWSALGGKLNGRVYGALGGLLNLLVCQNCGAA